MSFKPIKVKRPSNRNVYRGDKVLSIKKGGIRL